MGENHFNGLKKMSDRMKKRHLQDKGLLSVFKNHDSDESNISQNLDIDYNNQKWRKQKLRRTNNFSKYEKKLNLSRQLKALTKRHDENKSMFKESVQNSKLIC